MAANPNHWYKQGEQFSQAANILWKASGAAVKIENVQNLKVFPYVVNLAFAMECYSKCLLTNRDVIYRKTHDLLALFELLPQTDRKELIFQYRAVSKNNKASIKTLKDTVLPQIQHIFIQWRYPYDQAGMLDLIFNYPQWYHDSLLYSCQKVLKATE